MNAVLKLAAACAGGRTRHRERTRAPGAGFALISGRSWLSTCVLGEGAAVSRPKS